MELDVTRLLEYLSEDPDARKLVHDVSDDRWFVYSFDSDPPEVTSVRKDIAGRLLEERLIVDRGDDTRVEFPGDDYRVFKLEEGAAGSLEEHGA